MRQAEGNLGHLAAEETTKPRRGLIRYARPNSKSFTGSIAASSVLVTAEWEEGLLASMPILKMNKPRYRKIN
jgi:hypothetical protein